MCGLFLAYNIKTLFEKRVNVLVLDTRSSHDNTREPFKREWLTNINARNFKIDQTSGIFTLLESLRKCMIFWTLTPDIKTSSFESKLSFVGSK